MATAPSTLPVLQEDKRAKEKDPRADERRKLRAEQLEDALKILDDRHQEERQELSEGLRKLAATRRAFQDQLLADWNSSPFPDLGPGRLNLTDEQQVNLSADEKHHVDRGKERALDSAVPTLVELVEEEAASKLKYLKKLSREENRRSSQQEDGASAASLNGKEESVLEASQQRDKENQTLLKELLPEKNESHVEVQHLREVLDKKEFRGAYEHRIRIEDPREIKAHQRTLAAEKVGRWRFLSKKKVEDETKRVQRDGKAEDEIDYVDKKKLGYPKLPECYKEIKKLLDVEKNPIFSATLKEWSRKEELYNSRVECKKSRVANLKIEVYQLIGFFSVFQGVVLTAVSQSSLLYCHNKWSPIALSVLASLISTLAVTQKLTQIYAWETNVDTEERDYQTAADVGKWLRRPEPKGIDFVQLSVYIDSCSNRKSTKRNLAWLYFVLVISILVAFGVLFPVSFWRILCKPGSPPAPPAPPVQ